MMSLPDKEFRTAHLFATEYILYQFYQASGNCSQYFINIIFRCTVSHKRKYPAGNVYDSFIMSSIGAFNRKSMFITEMNLNIFFTFFEFE